MPVAETCRSVSFCQHALYQTDLLVVNDATADARFADNDLVTGDPFIRFYAGSQIISPNGFVLGTLCVIDIKPKELTWQQAGSLKLLAQQVSKLIELRYKKTGLKKLEEKLSGQQTVLQTLTKQQQRDTKLSSLNNQLQYSFLKDNYENLETGRFTKKSLSEISVKLHRQAQNIKMFEETKLLLHQMEQYGQPLKKGTIKLAAVIEEALTEYDEAIKSAGNKISCFVADATTINHHRYGVQLVLKLVLQNVLQLLRNKKVSLAGIQKEKQLEIKISTSDAGLRRSLMQYFIVADEQIGIENKAAHFELRLAAELMLVLDGDVQYAIWGDEGIDAILSFYID